MCFLYLPYTLVGAHAEAWRHRHLHAHHFAPNVEAYDSDLQLSGIIRLSPHSRHLWYHAAQHLYAPFAYAFYSLFWIFFKDFKLLYTKEKGVLKGGKYHLSFWVQKVLYFGIILVLPLLFSGQTALTVLLGFATMHGVQSVFLLFTFLMTHHVEGTAYPATNAAGCIQTSWLRNQIGSSNYMHPFSRTVNFILGGFNNHVAHHLFPGYHHSYYPAVNRILYPFLQARNIIPNQTTYWGGIASHLRLLRQMSIAPSLKNGPDTGAEKT